MQVTAVGGTLAEGLSNTETITSNTSDESSDTDDEGGRARSNKQRIVETPPPDYSNLSPYPGVCAMPCHAISLYYVYIMHPSSNKKALQASSRVRVRVT